MKKTLLSAIIAIAGATAITSVHATPSNAVSGDVILAFESTSLNKDLLVDLGQGSTFASALSGGSFSSINLDADLITTFGSDWATSTNSNVQWGLFGIPSSRAIVYATVAEGNNALVKKGINALAGTLQQFNALWGGYNTDIANNQALTVGVEQIVGTAPDTGFKTWIGNTPTTTPFAVYNVSIQNGVAGNLDVYGTTSTTSTKEGTLTVSANGVISAVPEPSTYALFGLGVLVLVVAYRRRRTA